MRLTKKGMLRGLILGVSASLIAACGGGGGGGGGSSGVTPTNEYEVRLTASRTALPLNLDTDPCFNPPSPSAPNAATLFVQAFRRGTNDPIPGGEDVFSCNVQSGLESGSLYYFRGEDDDKVEITCGPDDEREIEGAFRNIVLGANAGGNSFHVLSKDRVGNVVVRCSVTDPQSGKQAFKDITINVGGAASGKPSQVVLNHAAPNFLFVQGQNDPTQRVVQVRVVDEAGQAVPNPPAGVPNLIARIVDDPNSLADNAAQLRSGAQSGKSVTASTINGQAQFAIVSGNATGLLRVEFFADRSDNNVANGIGEPIFNAASVPVVSVLASSPLALETTELPDAFFGTFYAQFIEASGGIAPYTFALRTGNELPLGLTLSTDGVISGTPQVAGDNIGFIVEVTDSAGTTVSRAYVLNIKAEGGAALAISTESLPDGVTDVDYAALLQAAGGKPPYTWTKVGGAPAFSVSSGAAFGTVTASSPIAAGTYNLVVQVQDANGATAVKGFSITIAAPAAP